VSTLPTGVTGPTESGAAECTITGQTVTGPDRPVAGEDPVAQDDRIFPSR